MKHEADDCNGSRLAWHMSYGVQAYMIEGMSHDTSRGDCVKFALRHHEAMFTESEIPLIT